MKFALIFVFAAIFSSAHAMYGIEDLTLTLELDDERFESHALLTMAYHGPQVILWVCPSDQMFDLIKLAKSQHLHILKQRAIVFPFDSVNEDFKTDINALGYTTYIFTVHRKMKFILSYRNINDITFQMLMDRTFRQQANKDQEHMIVQLSGADSYYDRYCEISEHRDQRHGDDL